MKIAVYDTYVTKSDGTLMHFDIMVPEGVAHKHVLEVGRLYLETVGEENATLTPKECAFCHVGIADAKVRESICSKGFFIYEMEGCVACRETPFPAK